MLDLDTTLSNGLRVLLSVDHEQPRVAARVMVGAGASLDPQGFLGTAHALEHLMANKGTQRLGTRDWAAEAPLRAEEQRLLRELAQGGSAELLARLSEVEAQADAYALPNELKVVSSRIGGQGLNATTSMDRTVYLVDLPSNQLQAWAELEADRFRSPVFRGYRMELQTIVREKLRSFDNAGRAMYQAVMTGLFPGHPYGGTVLGELEQLLAPDFGLLSDYHARWYVPQNMAVVLAGDLDPEVVLPLLESTLGQLPGGPVPKRPQRELGEIHGTQRVEVVHQAPEELWISWRLPPGDHPDLEPMILADVLLSNGATGRLDTELVQPQKLLRAGTMLRSMREAGSFMLWGAPRPGQSLEEVESLLRGELAALMQAKVDPASVAQALQAFQIGYEVGLESNDRRADLLIHALARGLDPAMVLGRRERLATVELPEIAAALGRWTQGAEVVVTRKRGDPKIPELPQAPEGGRSLDTQPQSSAFAKGLVERPVAPLQVQCLREGEHWQTLVGPGGPLYSAPNPYNRVAQLGIQVALGHRHSGVLEQAVRAWGRSGVGGLSHTQVNAELFAKGLSVRLSCRAWHTELSVSGPEDALAEGLSLAVARLAQPEMDAEDVHRTLSDVVKRRQEQKPTAGVRGWVLSVVGRHGPDSPHLERLSDAEMLALEPADLVPKVQGLLGLERTLFLTSQGLGPSDLGVLEPLSELQAGSEQPIRRFLRPQSDRVLFMHHPGAQAQVRVLVPSEGYAPDRVPLYRVLDQVLGSSSGLIFQELRERRGLAYSAGASYERGSLPGHDNLLGLHAQVRPDQVHLVVGLLLELLRAPKLDQERIARAKLQVSASLQAERTGFRSVARAAWSWKRRGMAGDPRAPWLQAVKEMDGQALGALWQQLSSTPVTVLVMGDSEGVDLQALGAIAPLETLELDALLPY